MRIIKRNSEQWMLRTGEIIPGCSQTFSKSPKQFPRPIAPAFAMSGDGPYLTDLDGNRFLDYPMALGAVILGYSHPAVTRAVEEQLRQGTAFSLPHYLELELAERLVEIIPCAEMVRFAKNGSDATAGAVRLSRAVTGRDRVACCGYHGWQDWYIGTTPMNAGVPEAVRSLTHTFAYNDLASLEALLKAHPGEFAAVIMEPAGQVPAPGFLEGVRDLAHLHGAILIYDEVVSGFRLHIGGAQALYGVTPDLACFGKAMANGFPISTLVGRSELMKEMDKIFFSFTHGGECLSIAAALATIKVLVEEDGISRIHKYGTKLMEACRGMILDNNLSDYVNVTAHPQNMAIAFKEKSPELLVLKSLFQQEAISNGILFNGNHATTLSHGPAEFERTVEVYSKAFATLSKAVESGTPEKFLRCEPVRPIFSVRPQK